MAFFNFAPSTSAPFQFSPTLDGQIYNATVPWLLFGARFYLNLVALDGTPILYTAIAGSPPALQLQSLSWANGSVSAGTAVPHGYRIASTVALTISGCTPDAYNGKINALITGPSSLSYLLANDPGSATVFGAVAYNLNLIGGVAKEDGTFFASTLVYRTQNRQFEVSP